MKLMHQSSFSSGNETLDDILSEPGTAFATSSPAASVVCPPASSLAFSSAPASLASQHHHPAQSATERLSLGQHLAAVALPDVVTTPGPSSVSVTSLTAPPTPSRTPSLPSDDGEFPCSHCEKKFGNRRNLLSHMRRHTGDFKLFCESCGKGFFTQSKLDSHKR